MILKGLTYTTESVFFQFCSMKQLKYFFLKISRESLPSGMENFSPDLIWQKIDQLKKSCTILNVRQASL